MHGLGVSLHVKTDLACAKTMVKTGRSDDGLADTRPPMLVTASVDAIHMRHQLSMDNDMMVEGRVYASPLLRLTCMHNEG